MFLFILWIILGSTHALCGNSHRIVGGEDTDIRQYPYMANVELNWGTYWSQWCGGSLITTRSVLSAAHCYGGGFPWQFRVRLGSSSVSSGGTVYQVSELVVHERFDTPLLDNDIAIVKLASPAVLSTSVAVARIAGTNYNLADNTPVIALGWGRLWSAGPTPDILQNVQLFTVNHNVCVQRYDYLRTLPGFHDWPEVSPGMLCAGILDIGGKSTCQGDSGGPLAHQRDVVVGVTSWAYRCAEAFYPGVYVDVSYYVNWIVSNA